MDSKKTTQQEADEQQQQGEAAKSSTDQKNDKLSGGYTPATDRVKPRAGDGLTNEGTNVSYEGER
ncbi:MAG: hypothetical protein JWQ27_420 [Ferruginibacter sp.]|nr:hypothetical protein [Ferruginibacter sp.]